MYKDGNQINIDLLSKTETDERNGVEIYVDLVNSYDFSVFRKKIKDQLAFFDNVYVIDTIDKESNSNIEDRFNDSVIKHYDNFSVTNIVQNTYDSRMGILLGKVKYPLNVSKITIPSNIYKLSEQPISLRFEIGDLEITPNREEIQYTSKTIELIEEKFALAFEEVSKLFEGKFVQSQLNSHEEISDFISSYRSLNLIDDVERPLVIAFPNSSTILDSVKVDIQYKDLKFKSFESLKQYHTIFRTIYNSHIKVSTKNLYAVSNGQIQNQKLSSIYVSTFLRYPENFYNCDIQSLKNVTKSYIRETFDIETKFVHFNKSIAEIYKQYYGIILNHSLEIFPREYIKHIFKDQLSTLKINKFTDESVPKDWIKKYKATRKASRTSDKNWNKKFTYYTIRNADVGNPINTTADSHNIELKNFFEESKRNLIVYASSKEESYISEMYNIHSKISKPKNNIKFITVAETRQKWIKDMENAVHAEEVLKNPDYSFLRNLNTVEYIKKNYPFIFKLKEITNLGRISTSLSEKIDFLGEFINDNDSTSKLKSYYYPKIDKFIDEVYQVALDYDLFNQEIMTFLSQNEKLFKNAQFLTQVAGTKSYSSKREIPEPTINLVVDYILTKKLFMVDPKAVEKLREETINNIKVEKNEDI